MLHRYALAAIFPLVAECDLAAEVDDHLVGELEGGNRRHRRVERVRVDQWRHQTGISWATIKSLENFLFYILIIFLVYFD